MQTLPLVNGSNGKFSKGIWITIKIDNSLVEMKNGEKVGLCIRLTEMVSDKC